MSKARTIKNNHAMGVRSKVNETAGFEIFYLCAISMNQQEWLPGSAVDAVQAHAIDIKELCQPLDDAAPHWTPVAEQAPSRRAKRLPPPSQLHISPHSMIALAPISERA